MAIEKKLICFARLEEFERQLAAGNIKDYSIVLIQDAKKIYNRGTYYDCSGITQEQGDERYVRKITEDGMTVSGIDQIRIPFSGMTYAFSESGNGNEDGIILTSDITKTINGQSLLGVGDITIEGGSADNVYITDFTVNELQSIAGQSAESIQSQTSLLYEAVVSHKIILVPYDTDEGFQGYGVAVGYCEDMIYLTILLGGEFIDLELDLNNDEINGGQVALRSWYNKQDRLVSGTNIKTINGQSILGSGNIEIKSSGEANVQSDWTQEDAEDDSYIKNRTHYCYASTYIGQFVTVSKEVGDVLFEGLSEGVQYTILNNRNTSKNYSFQFVTGRKINIPFNGPTVEAVCSEDGSLVLASSTYGIAESFSVHFAEVKQLDDIYIPETIARTSELKTINGESIVGSGDLTIEGGAKIYEWFYNGESESVTLSQEEYDNIVEADLVIINTVYLSFTVSKSGKEISEAFGAYSLIGQLDMQESKYTFSMHINIATKLATLNLEEQNIPTKTSQLENDSNFISSDGLKTINGESIVGSGNIEISGGSGTITGVSANGTSIATSGVANIPAASTSAYGVTKLSTATNSTSTTLAATASAVKAAYDLASGKASMSDVNTAIANAITTTLNTAV